MNRRTLGRWAGYNGIAIVFAIVCIFLSRWQFDRNEQRSSANELIAQNYDAQPVALADALGADGSFEPANEWQQVSLQGRYLPEHQLAARNRPLGGSVAVEVLVPFQLDDGTVIVIDRGWVEPGENSEPSAIPEPPAGEVTVIARIKPGEQLPRSGRTEAPEGQVPSINLPLISDLTGLDIVTGAYGLMASETPAAETTPHALDRPEQDPGPHLSYAIQWILFAVMGFVFIFYMIRTEIKHSREEREDAEAIQRGEAPKQRAKRVRRDRDADEEDALLG